jgi:hypothetical protein
MLRRFRDRFGTAGLVVAIMAMVVALGGTALAASGALTGKQKKEVTKIAKKYAGKPGAPGATGPAGPAGPAGPKGDTGAKGDKGDAGAKGETGAKGTNGVSVTTAAASEAECGKAGGVKLTSASGASKVCNGTTGFTKTLPPGETETGTWSVALISPTFSSPAAAESISFPIPLEEGGQAFLFDQEKTNNEEFGTSGCAGSFAEPTAPPGVLCLYTRFEERSTFESAPTVSGILEPRSEPAGFGEFSPVGAFLTGIALEGGPEPAVYDAMGSWAVTAATP